MTKVRALLFQAGLPNYLWGEALETAVFLYNRTPHSTLNGKTPYEIKYGVKPNLSTIRVFGSVTFYKVKGLGSQSKLKARASKAILLGFSDNAEVYKLWDIDLRKVVYSRDVEIQEGTFHPFFKDSTELEELENNELPSESKEPSDSKEEEEETNKSPPAAISLEKDPQGTLGPNRKPTTSMTSSKPSIVVEIPKKTADYYRDF